MGSFGDKGIYLIRAADGQLSVVNEKISDPYHMATDASGRSTWHITVALMWL